MTKRSPFRYFKSSPEIIRLAVMRYNRFPLSLRRVEDLRHERGIEISHETVRYWWNRFDPMFAAEIRGKRVEAMRTCRQWQRQVDEAYVKINGRRITFGALWITRAKCRKASSPRSGIARQR
jgi:putative transposase